MTEPCEVLDWDTAFFGFRVARVRDDALTSARAREIDAWCSENRIRCLYFLARADDACTTRLAEANGFHLVDVRMTFRRTLSAGPSDRAGPVRPARPDDVPLLQEITRECYQGTRFSFDPNFPCRLSVALYETWIRVSCEGAADIVLVAEAGGVPAGFISCHLSGEGRIGLIGVAACARGAGLGETLVQRALQWFSERGARQVSVVTQARNFAAQRVFQRCGFLTHAVELWYHKWFSSSDSTCE